MMWSFAPELLVLAAFEDLRRCNQSLEPLEDLSHPKVDLIT